MHLRALSAVLLLMVGGFACRNAGYASGDAPSFEVDTADVQVGTPQRRFVAVHIGCNKNDVSARISPWTRQLVAGDTLEWRFQGTGYQLDSVRITPKGGTSWPLDATPPYRGNPNTPARGGVVRPGAGAGPHNYDIQFWCKSGSDSLYGVIDPDIIVLQ